MYRTDFWTLWEKARVGCFERTASKHVYYLGWNRSPAQVGCLRQVLRPGALGKPRGTGWRGRWEGGSGWGIHVTPWLIHVNVRQNPLQYCKVICLQLIKINEKKIKRKVSANLKIGQLKLFSLRNRKERRKWNERKFTETQRFWILSTIFRQWESQKKRGGEAERIFEEILAGNFTNLMKTLIYTLKKFTRFYVGYIQRNNKSTSCNQIIKKKKSLGLRGNLMHV